MGQPFLEMRELTRRRRVSTQLEQELAVRGVAQAVVFLEPPDMTVRAPLRGIPRGTDDLGDLETCFVKDERSMAACLASASLAMAANFPRRGPRAKANPEATPRYYSDIPRIRKFPALGVIMGDIHHDGLERLAVHPRVRYVASSFSVSLIRPTGARNAALSTDTTTWGIEMLEIPALWAAGLRGDNVRVGHLDTGVDANHPALMGAVAGFLYTDLHGNADPAVAPKDTEEHGTHTAGTIAGRPVSGRSIGVAPGALLYSAVVADGGNLVARILTGMEWAFAQGVRILNLSVGIRPYNDDFRRLMSALRAAGILPVCSVGNFGPGTSCSPGNYDLVLSVGEIDATGEVAAESSSQWFARAEDPLVPDVVAPGVDIISARPRGGYQSLDGSSQATPHISGLAALLWQAKPTATVAEIESAIFNSCRLGTMSQERANRGLPNGPRAYEALMGAPLEQTAPKQTAPKQTVIVPVRQQLQLHHEEEKVAALT
jgi:subtilisin